MLFAGALFALSAVVVSFNEKPTLAVLSGGIAVTLSSAASIIMRIEASLDILLIAVLIMVGSTAGIALLSRDKWGASFGWAFVRYLAGGCVGGICIYLNLTQSIIIGVPVVATVLVLNAALITIIFLPSGRHTPM